MAEECSRTHQLSSKNDQKSYAVALKTFVYLPPHHRRRAVQSSWWL